MLGIRSYGRTGAHRVGVGIVLAVGMIVPGTVALAAPDAPSTTAEEQPSVSGTDATSTTTSTTTGPSAADDESTDAPPAGTDQPDPVTSEPDPVTSEPDPSAPVTSDPTETEAPVEEAPADTVAGDEELPAPDSQEEAEESTEIELAAPAPCGVYGTVAAGSPASWVRCTELWLDFLGYDAGTVNGTFDGRTEAALRSFQSDEGIRVTGTGTPLAMTRLGIWSGRSLSGSCSVNRTVPARSSSWSAFCVEKRLAQLGYAVGQGKAFDGPSRFLDPGSVASLRSFARARGLPWRGDATPLLLRALGIWSGRSFAGSCSVWATVPAGAYSGAAMCVERRLAQLGYAVGQGRGLDGPSRYLDPGSLASLRAFARSEGVPWRGSATPLLLRELGIWSGRSLAGSCTVSKTIRQGEFSNAGLCLEKSLAQRGFAVGQGKPYDGPSRFVDAGTIASVRAFQRNHGLVVDGVAGPVTLSRLGIWKPPPPGALPADSGTGRRVVYSKSQMRVWTVEADGRVSKTHLVSGNSGWNYPTPGTYRVFSKSTYTCAYGNSSVCWRYMVRFAKGPGGGNIGFHEIPTNYATGRRLQSDSQLGQALSAGCVRQSTSDAIYMWNWAPVGTKVVVLP